ncbi:dicarboxylate/amino acid:cation symporter [Nocardia sp. NBC_00508]|uniref:dicarboxylate/amino acid:cation symporter n=1 Tax=Nocardia sp. NBC_00508 TaxID=2975992 RepID=UPI002E7FC5C1|nr:dicarboxylate/amino acid:cation symporter [Nocardia sp. NBC_00508]WUD68520.1 dicarboxylate/amino acid:cation symporter [Nocardia sp. NBC_00508]
MKNKTSAFIVGAIALGIGAGLSCHYLVGSAEAREIVVGALDTVTHLFLNLVKMVVAPLIFATIVSGVTGATESLRLGNLTARCLAWFFSASILVGVVGFTLAHLMGVGHGLHLVATGEDSGLDTALNYSTLISDIAPQSFVKALAENKPMQILVFGVFFGAALLALKRTGRAKIANAIDELATVMLKVTGYVMKLAPIGVFTALGSAFAEQGLDAFATYGMFIAGFYAALASLWGLLVGIGAIFLGRAVFRLMAALREPAFIAFSTASAEAAFPRLIETLSSYGIDRRITGFVLPMGYAFNLDGSMLYMTFASVFLVNAYEIDLSVPQQIAMVLVLFLSSKGMASVPRGSLVVIAAVAPGFGVPAAGIGILLAIDQILDMGRTATNVIGNGIATAVLGRNPNPGPGDDKGPRVRVDTDEPAATIPVSAS